MNKKLLYFIISLKVILSLCSACDYQHRQFEQVVKEWSGKTIFFPKNIVFTKYASDTIELPSINTDYKILLYINNSGCMNCRMNLSGWESFMKSIDTITSVTISFLFFIYPDDINNIQYILRRNRFEHPICIDLEDSLNSLNHFSTEYDFQTFLLDKNNEVVCIGNPIRNLSIRSLYYEIITGKHYKKEEITKDLKGNFPQEIDFGTFSWRDSKELYFSIHSRWQENVKIKELTSSCDCITVEPEKEIVAPGEEVRIYISYQAKEAGEFFREILVCLDNGEKYVVNVRGCAVE